MAKRQEQRGPAFQQPRPIPAVVVTPPPIQIPAEVTETAAAVPFYRRCPLCWDRCKGVGVSYSTQGNRRYYRCKRTLTEEPACGHTWTAIVKLEVLRVEHRTVEIAER